MLNQLLKFGSIREIENTNISYVEPHQIVIKDITFLAFNYSNTLFISNLRESIEINKLEDYIK